MSIDADFLEGLREILIDDTDVAALVSTRVFGIELPRSEANSQPRKAIVLSLAGGLGSSSYIEHGQNTVDVLCYGETPFEAERVRRTVHPVLKQITRVIRAGVLIHSAIAVGGPITLRDRDTDWPISLETWQVSAAEVSAL